MEQSTKFIGVDVRKATLVVAVADSGGGEVRYHGEIANTPEAVAKLVRQLRKGGVAAQLLLRGRYLRLLPATTVERSRLECQVALRTFFSGARKLSKWNGIVERRTTQQFHIGLGVNER